MTAAGSQGDAAKFLFGAGVLAHYVGDGCQPLHGSYMADGNPADDRHVMYTPPRGGSKHPAGVPYDKVDNAGKGIHSAYEDKMIDAYIGEIMDNLQTRVNEQDTAAATAGSTEALPVITNGQQAGFAVLQLMKLTQEDIKPEALVEVFKAAKASKADMNKALHDQFIDKTITVLARGSLYLGHIWKPAWEAGNSTVQNAPDGVPKGALQDLYKETTNLQSYLLSTIDPVLMKP